MEASETERRDARAAQIVQVRIDGMNRAYGFRWGLRTIDPHVGQRVGVPWRLREAMGTVVSMGPSPDYDGEYATVVRRLG
jgi:primosomal protein N'